MSTTIDVIVKGIDYSSQKCVFRTVVLKSDLSLLSQMQQEYTKYVIKWNFDLGGNALDVPVGCILVFDGGQLSNGSIHWNDTKVLNQYRYEILKNITESGDKIEL